MSTAANRQINIYVNSGDAEKAFERLTNQNTKLTKSVNKNQEELTKLEKELASFNGAKSSKEFKELKNAVDLKRASVEKDTTTMKLNNQEMDRIQKKIKGELSPSYTDMAKLVAALTKELKAMSREDGGFKEKIEQLKKAKSEMADFESSFKKTEENYGAAFGGAESVAIGTLAAGEAMQFVDRFKAELNQGFEDAKVFQGVEEAFKRLNRPDLLDEMRHAVKGTVNDLEIMELAVQADNFEIPLEHLATLFEFAKKRAQDTGQEVDFLVQSIVTGIGRKSPLILDNLGISAVRLRQELKGVAAESATIGDVTTAVGRVIAEESAKAGTVTDTYAVKVAQSRAEWENLRRELGTKLLPVVNFVNSAFYGTMSVLGKLGGAFINLFTTQKSAIGASVDSHMKMKQEADTAQYLLNRYNELRIKGVKATADEKAEMTKITYQLKDAFGESVVAINKETGALEVNIKAVKEAIKQKIILSNAELGKIALEYNNAKAQKALSEAELDRINKARGAENDATLGSLADSKVRSAIYNEDESQFLKLKPLREAALEQGKKILEAEKTMLETKKEMGKYGITENDMDFDKWAKLAVDNNKSNKSGGGDVGKDKKDTALEKQKQFIERMKEIRRDFEISEATQDEKEIEAVRVKYAKMVEELDKAFPKMTSQAKAFRDELYMMRLGALAATMNEQDYRKSLKASDDYFKELQTKYKEAYANGQIDKSEYDSLIVKSDIALKNDRVRIANEFSDKSKQAEGDRVKFAEDANNTIRDQKIKDKEYLDQLMKDDLASDEAYYDAVFNSQEIKAKEKLQILSEYFSMGNQLMQGFLALSAHDYNADLNREQRANEKKKQDYKRMLDSKRISQSRYNDLVEKADEESAKKQNDIKRRQFEADKEQKRMAILGDTAAAIMRAAASAPFPANLIPIGFATLQGGMQLAAVNKTKFQEMKYGGILNGPSHDQGGLKVYNPQTGMIEAELEGGESHIVMSKPFTEANADIIPSILAASRKGTRLYDELPAFNTPIPRINTTRALESIQFANGGIIPGTNPQPTTTTLSTNNNSANNIDGLATLNNNLVQLLGNIDSKILPTNYELLAKNVAEYLKKYGVLK